MKNLYLALITASLMTFTAQAGNVEALETAIESDVTMNVARVQNVFPIKKAKNANTRINLLVIDNGGSTDVSPTMSLYLTFWQDGEMGDTTATFELGRAFQLLDFKILPGNVLQLKKKIYDENGFRVVTQNVNFNEFAQKFEREAKLPYEEFQIRWVKGHVISSQD